MHALFLLLVEPSYSVSNEYAQLFGSAFLGSCSLYMGLLPLALLQPARGSRSSASLCALLLVLSCMATSYAHLAVPRHPFPPVRIVATCIELFVRVAGGLYVKFPYAGGQSFLLLL